MKQREINITKVFNFDCAHHLNNYNGKCKNIHGHTYRLEITVKGAVKENGLVIDFHDLDDIVKINVLDYIDHRYLNELFEFNPTCELLGLWIWDNIDKAIAEASCSLEKLVLWETPTSFITLDREDMG